MIFFVCKGYAGSEKSATEAGSRFGKFYVSASLQNTLPLMQNSSSTQTAASEEAKQSRRRQKLLIKSLKASESDFFDPALHFPDSKFIFLLLLCSRTEERRAQPCRTAYCWQSARGRKLPKDFCLAVTHIQMQREKGRS